MDGARGRIACCMALGLVLWSAPARAHWCHDLWGSSYNIVVKPAVDTVNVPAGGQATLNVFVQNNMGYPLKNFALRATATGYTVSISRQAPKVSNFLMPGENLRHTLTLGSSAGGSLSATALRFYVDFGDGTQDELYGGGTTGARHAVIRSVAGGLQPPSPISVPWPDMQAEHLGSSAKADYENLTQGLDLLMREFCAGRGSWDTGGGASNTTYCNGTATTCPAAVTRGHTKWDYQHLWASFELAYRKASLGARAAPLRERLACATNDSSPAFKFFPYAMLGYLGEDSGARTFFTNKISNGTADEKAAAKAGLLLFGNAADRTAYHADVTAALGATNEYVQMLAATTLGIIDANDSAVNTELVPRAQWVEPDTADNGKAFFAAHLLNLVAWNRRGWAVDAAYNGTVSFYEGGTVDTTPPKAPAGISCTAQANGTVRVTWSAVTQNVNNGAETIQTYRVYSGTTARPATATRPGEQGFDYDHLDPTTSLAFNFTGLSGTQTHYFTVLALDTAGNASVYGQEVSCVPRYAPTAAVSCSPTTGTAPISISCDSSGSTDPNGVADISTRAWRLDGVGQPSGTTFATSFTGPGSHVVQLTVTDSTGLSNSASASITVNAPGNQTPTAQASATPTNGPAPLAVQLSSAGSSDPDTGQSLSYSWNFGDGSPDENSANPTHTFASVGSFDVTLTVTDDGTPPASAVAQVTVTVQGNSPPDLSACNATPTNGAAPLTVHFDASGAYDPDGHALSYSWDFGDGSAVATSALADHTYAAEGSYVARLSVTDDGLPALAGPATKDFTITVGPVAAANRPPDCAAATVSPASGQLPLQVVLDASGCVDPDGDALTFSWHVPRSTVTEDVYTEARVEVTITAPGSHELRLHVRDEDEAPLEIDRVFTIEATAPMPAEVIGGCGCATGAGAPIVLLVLAGLLGARRKKRA